MRRTTLRSPRINGLFTLIDKKWRRGLRTAPESPLTKAGPPGGHFWNPLLPSDDPVGRAMKFGTFRKENPTEIEAPGAGRGPRGVESEVAALNHRLNELTAQLDRIGRLSAAAAAP